MSNSSPHTELPEPIRRIGLLACLFLATGIGLVPPALAQPAGPIPIEVGSTEELLAEMVSENAGRTIHLLHGSYELSAPLVIPDGIAISGDGVMLSRNGLPTGFEPGSETRIVAAEGFTGDLLTLGNGVRLSGLSIDYTLGTQGNAVSVGSRGPDDVVSTRIANCAIDTNLLPASGFQGPIGRGIAVLSNNPNLGNEPSAHAGSAIVLKLRHSIIRSNPGGNALTAFNFAPQSRIRLELDSNRIRGGLDIAGGISRPDPVSESRTILESRHNLYFGSNDSYSGSGWRVYGGTAPPIPLGPAETNSNSVRVSSVDDQIKGFGIGVYAVAGQRYHASQGTSSGNFVRMHLLGLRIRTPDVPGAADLYFNAALPAFVSDPFAAGDNNTIRVLMRGSTGSGERANLYTIAGDGSLEEQYQGTGNRLEFLGTAAAFDAANEDFDLAPPAIFFKGEAQ